MVKTHRLGGQQRLWSVENGEIVGKSPGIKKNEFLSTTASYGDFVMKYKFRIVNTSGQANSGMQFRSSRVPTAPRCTAIRPTSGRSTGGACTMNPAAKKILVQPDPQALEKVLNLDGWNEYVITCQGDHVTLELNGLKTADWTETEPVDKVARSGCSACRSTRGADGSVCEGSDDQGVEVGGAFNPKSSRHQGCLRGMIQAMSHQPSALERLIRPGDGSLSAALAE